MHPNQVANQKKWRAKNREKYNAAALKDNMKTYFKYKEYHKLVKAFMKIIY